MNRKQSLSEVPLCQFQRHLGLPACAELDDRLAALAAGARRWYSEHGAPWILYRLARIARFSPAVIHLTDGARLTSGFLRAGLEAVRAPALVVVALSAGGEVDEEIGRLWRSGRPDEAMFLSAYAAATAEELRDDAAARIRRIAARRGLSVLPHYSPGYEGWNLADQHALYELIAHAPSWPGERPPPLTLLPSGALEPLRSTLAVIGVTASPPPSRGGFEGFWCSRDAATEAAPDAASSGERSVYSAPQRVLARWASERLSITATDRGQLRATFRFDGTTCSNMGTSIAMVYEVTLSGATSADCIVRASVRPAPGDGGHRSMCAFLAAPERFLETVAASPPWVGRTLERALDTLADASPSGCLCTHADRRHKWRVVLQTIHYAFQDLHTAGGGAAGTRETSRHEITSS